MLEGLKNKNTTGTVITLQGDAQAMNNLENETIRPVPTAIAVQKGQLTVALAPYSFQVVRVKVE